MLHPVRGEVPGMLGDRPAVLPGQVSQQPQNEPAGPPPRFHPGKPARDRSHQLIEHPKPAGRVYAVALRPPQDHQELNTTRDDQPVAVLRPAPPRRKITIYGWSTSPPDRQRLIPGWLLGHTRCASAGSPASRSHRADGHAERWLWRPTQGIPSGRGPVGDADHSGARAVRRRGKHCGGRAYALNAKTRERQRGSGVPEIATKARLACLSAGRAYARGQCGRIRLRAPDRGSGDRRRRYLG